MVCWHKHIIKIIRCYYYCLSIHRYAKPDMDVTRPQGLAQVEDDTYIEDDDNCSDVSSTLAHSVVSTVPDKHGFLGGAQYINES